MFNAEAAFAKSFIPVEGGYLYYPSARSGGKPVTSEEYERLLAGWRRGTGWRLYVPVFAGILLFEVAAVVLEWPQWTFWPIVIAAVAGVMAAIFWVSFAPRRLVKGRADAAPPRSGAETRRHARSMVGWPFVAGVLIVSGAWFLGMLAVFDWTLAAWLWVAGSGSIFAAYLWVAVQKLRDRSA